MTESRNYIDPVSADDYDSRADAFKSWELAIRAMRLAGIREGRYAPLPDRPEEVAAAGHWCGAGASSEPVATVLSDRAT